jgi:pyrroline-5-carboxylate reductase
MKKQLGILGVGHLASYVVAGLRNAGDQRTILLSPRGIQRSAALKAQHNCEVAPDNQSVIDNSYLILLSVRPAQMREILTPLIFTAEHVVISCLAGVSLSDLEPLVKPAKVIRTLPLACAEVGKGAIPLYPSNESAAELLKQLGEVITLDNEDHFELASVAACMNGWMYRFFAELTDWYTAKGLDSAQARNLVVQSVLGAAELAANKTDWPLTQISDSIATEGTYTKTGLDNLLSADAFKAWADASDLVEAALLKKGSS